MEKLIDDAFCQTWLVLSLASSGQNEIQSCVQWKSIGIFVDKRRNKLNYFIGSISQWLESVCFYIKYIKADLFYFVSLYIVLCYYCFCNDWWYWVWSRSLVYCWIVSTFSMCLVLDVLPEKRHSRDMLYNTLNVLQILS